MTTKSIKTLPVVEKWDCHGCGHCCRRTTILLDDNDLQTLHEQKWQDHPDFSGVRTVVRQGFGGHRVLGKKADGSCVFLTSEGRCRIHELHGAEAKPSVCRMFPLQLVSLGKYSYLTTRRSCPSAAADRGRPLDEHVRSVKNSGFVDRFELSRATPPAIVRGAVRTWPEFLVAAEALTRLMTDERFPPVRRIIHALRFCELLSQCKLRRVKEESWQELIEILETSSQENSGDYFRDRQAPSRGTALLFRQLGVHYVRSHPGFTPARGWREQWRLVRMLAKFARGKGSVPALHAELPAASFDDLEQPLGPLAEEVARPLNRFFETQATSKQYAMVMPRQSLVESFRSLALTYPMGLWLLRLGIGDREPLAEEMIDVVVALEGGQGLPALARAATAMAGTQQLERVVAWYAR
jgi:lysine-N-methylase